MFVTKANFSIKHRNFIRFSKNKSSFLYRFQSTKSHQQSIMDVSPANVSKSNVMDSFQGITNYNIVNGNAGKTKHFSNEFDFGSFCAWMNRIKIANKYDISQNDYDQKWSQMMSNIFSVIKCSAEYSYSCSTPNTFAELSVGHQRIIEQFTAGDLIDNADNDAYYIVDIGDILRQHQQWTELLPNVLPYYAIKCNPDPIILQLLHCLGCGFDCASKQEFEILEKLGIVDYQHKNAEINEKVIFSHPCKHMSHLKFAKANGIKLMTFDNEFELEKIKRISDSNFNLLLRIQVDDSHSICQFNSKYGCETAEIEELFELCKYYDLNLNGIMFHVGSGCMDANVYRSAIAQTQELFHLARNKYGFPDFNILDIGGGFPGINDEKIITFVEIASAITESIGNISDVCVIAEPGRYYVAKSHFLITEIASKKRKCKTFKYYINEGTYASFNCMYNDHAIPTFIPFRTSSNCDMFGDELFESVIFGPTCDSVDRMTDKYLLPDMSIGDKLIVPNFGAYTGSAGSEFNGFIKSKTYYAITHSF